jgi:hypothetical protein
MSGSYCVLHVTPTYRITYYLYFRTVQRENASLLTHPLVVKLQVCVCVCVCVCACLRVSVRVICVCSVEASRCRVPEGKDGEKKTESACFHSFVVFVGSST